MRTDRELLELAAKAAGYREFQYCEASGGLQAIYVDDDDVGFWNPLSDDGDALRLAVARWIEIRVFNGKAHAGKQDVFWCTEDCGIDPCAATRRAIVRAAAEIAAHPKQHNGGGADE